MAILTRIKNIFKININSLLDGAEDPAKVLDVVAEDMGQEIAKAKKQVSDAIAQQILMQSDLAEADAAVTDWLKKAETAIESNREDLAREALKERAKAEERAAFLKPRCEHFTKENERLKEELAAMEDRREEFLAQKEILIARAKVATARSSVALAPAPSLSNADSTAALERATDKIRKMEAQAEAAREVAQVTYSSSDKYDELERMHKESEVDEELARLKAKLGK